jgi:hypothetical protein
MARHFVEGVAELVGTALLMLQLLALGSITMVVAVLIGYQKDWSYRPDNPAELART